MSSVYCQRPLTPSAKFDPLISAEDFKLVWTSAPDPFYHSQPDYCWACHCGHLGSLTVVERTTGFMGSPRDVETGFRDCYSMAHRQHMDFWLASGQRDIRVWLSYHGPQPFSECVNWVKGNSNTCRGITEKAYLFKFYGIGGAVHDSDA